MVQFYRNQPLSLFVVTKDTGLKNHLLGNCHDRARFRIAGQ